MPTPQRLPIVNGDDGQWGDILVQWLKKEHYDDGTDNAVNGGHKTITVRAGTTAAGTAPLKLTSGSLMTTAEAGSLEFLTDRLYFTITTGAVRKTLAIYDDASGALGDTYYRDGSANFTPLAGNTTATKKFLTQTGNGSVSAAPAWNTIVAGDVPTLNQDTTGSAAKWTTARNLAGNSVDGSANVAFANKFIVQGTADSGLSAAQFLGALSTGYVKNTTTTGVLSVQAVPIPLADGGTNATSATTAFSNIKQDASDTATGVVELATITETTTGTDATRAVTPDGLAGSDYGKRIFVIQVTDPSGAVLAIGDGQAYVRISSELNGYNVVSVGAEVVTKSTSGIPTVQIARGRQSSPTSAHTFADVLSTKLTIDASEWDSSSAATAAVIDTANDDLATGDLLRIDVDVAGTGTKGLLITITAQLP